MPLCQVKVTKVFIDNETGVPIVLLQDLASHDTLPILIAPLEASLIAIELEGKKPIRPLTHDLIVNIIHELSYFVESIVITDLKNNIYYAVINIVSGNKKIQIDSRPSDAIAIALRTKSPIFVKRKVFVHTTGFKNSSQNIDKETLKEVLEDIELEDVGGKIM